METKPYSLQAPEEIAKEYGGNKQRIAQAIQSGLVDPTAGVLAGMFIDRMRSAQMEEQGAQQSVAQDVMTPGMTPGMAPGMAPPMPQGAPQMGGAMSTPATTPTPTPAQPPMPQGAPQTGGGLEALPVPNDMFSGPGMAGGGLVAFAEAGSVGMDPLEEQRRKDLERLRRQSGILGFLLPDTLPENRASSPGEFPGRSQQMPTVSGLEEYGVSPDTMVPREPTPYIDPAIQGAIEEVKSGIESGPYAGMTTSGRGARREAREDVSEISPELAEIMDLGRPDRTLPLTEEAPAPDMDALQRAAGQTGTGRATSSTARPSATPTAASTAEGEESALDRYAKMLMGSMQDKEATREDARNMAMLQAGLGIMGGESPYALQNIARGALPATQQYQQQMQQAREEERATIGALADLELKARELGLTEQRYNDLARIAEMQIAASGVKGDTSKLRGDIVKLAVQLMKSKEANMEPVSVAEAMTEATNAVLGGSQTRTTDTPTIDFNQLSQ